MGNVSHLVTRTAAFQSSVENGLAEENSGKDRQFVTALVGRDRLVELHLSALELLDDRLQLLERVLERQRGNILRQYRFFRQFGLSESRSMVARAYCQRA